MLNIVIHGKNNNIIIKRRGTITQKKSKRKLQINLWRSILSNKPGLQLTKITKYFIIHLLASNLFFFSFRAINHGEIMNL